MISITKAILILLYYSYCCVSADDIDIRFRNGVMLKFLREMVNQTKADTLNLPANATSIRENITDTFSCENRTYGYYADVDNECQVFHVCLTSQGTSQRNATYRWSFICPNETIFNQELLTCTRPRDSIDCEDAPMYYDVNLEIGKVPNDTQSNSEPGKDDNNMGTYNNNMGNYNDNMGTYNNMGNYNNNMGNYNNNNNNNNNNNKIGTYNNYMPMSNVNPYSETVRVKDRRKQTNRKKQNMVIASLMKEVINGEIKKGNVKDFGSKLKMENVNEELVPVIVEERPVIHEIGESFETNEETMGNSRLALERSLKRKGRKISRGSFRFKADVK